MKSFRMSIIKIKISVISLILLFSCQVFSQNIGKISGNLKSKNIKLEFATVLLSKQTDSTKIIANTFSDSTGYFVINNVAFGEYKIRFSLVGYHNISKNISLSAENQQIEIKDFELLEDGTQLQNITVTAQKRLIEKTAEGFIVNASANITQAGGTATDLLKNTPTVSVDADGAITLRGKTPQFLINGRASNLANPDQIPASSVESIEIITNASAKYDANSESGIINIRLKKNKDDGTNGAFALGLGMGAKARVSSSFLLNHKAKKWNFGLGYDNRFAGRTRKINSQRTNLKLPETYQLNQNRIDSRVEALQNLKFNIDFAPNDKYNLSFEAIGSKEGQDNDEDLFSILLKQNQSLVSNINRHSLEYAKGKVAEFALNLERKFTDKDKSLTANISTSLNYDRENTDIISQAFSETKLKNGAEFLERTHNYENGYITNATLDYTFSLNNFGQIETGYRGVFRNINADYEAATNQNQVYIVNKGASNIFDFSETVAAFYAQFNSNTALKVAKYWKYSFGLRAEQVNNKGATKDSKTSFTNNYLKLFPTVNFSYYLSNETFWKLSYGKRINRPNMGALNPFTDITDVLNPHSGNPNLKPEIAHNFELGYNKEGDNFSVGSNLFYRKTLNTIRQFFQLQPNGANLNLPINIGNASTTGLETILTGKPSKSFDFNASISAFQQHINGDNVADDAVQDAFGWYGKLINNFKPWQNSKFQVIGNYNSATVTPQGKRIAQYFVDLGFQQKLFKNGNGRLGVTLVDLFNTLKNGYRNSTNEFSNFRFGKVDTRAIMVTFGYSFRSAFKDKIMDNKFSREY
jgi:outer membrane receptor protein involved in Fe transport